MVASGNNLLIMAQPSPVALRHVADFLSESDRESFRSASKHVREKLQSMADICSKPPPWPPQYVRACVKYHDRRNTDGPAGDHSRLMSTLNAVRRTQDAREVVAEYKTYPRRLNHYWSLNAPKELRTRYDAALNEMLLNDVENFMAPDTPLSNIVLRIARQTLPGPRSNYFATVSEPAPLLLHAMTTAKSPDEVATHLTNLIWEASEYGGPDVTRFKQPQFWPAEKKLLLRQFTELMRVFFRHPSVSAADIRTWEKRFPGLRRFTVEDFYRVSGRTMPEGLMTVSAL